MALLFGLSVCLCLRANTRGQNFFFFWWEEEDGKRERAERPTQPGLKVSMPLTTCVFLSSLFAVFVCMCTACVCHSVHLPTRKRTAKGPSGRKKTADTKLNNLYTPSFVLTYSYAPHETKKKYLTSQKNMREMEGIEVRRIAHLSAEKGRCAKEPFVMRCLLLHFFPGRR